MSIRNAINLLNAVEFEDAVNYLHVQCQTLERAQLLLQKAEWLRYVLFTSAKIAI